MFLLTPGAENKYSEQGLRNFYRLKAPTPKLIFEVTDCSLFNQNPKAPIYIVGKDNLHELITS